MGLLLEVRSVLVGLLDELLNIPSLDRRLGIVPSYALLTLNACIISLWRGLLIFGWEVSRQGRGRGHRWASDGLVNHPMIRGQAKIIKGSIRVDRSIM